MLEKTNRVNLLFDFYSPLLKDRQRQFLSLYYRDDLSLGEIAELMEVSRQAVYDQLKRAEQALEQYEEKLELLALDAEREALLSQLVLSLQKEEWDQGEIRSLVNQLVEFELERD
jgi:uncharacterized protein